VKILCDVDGVIADSNSHMLAAIALVTGRYFTREQITEWSYAKALGISQDDEDRAWQVMSERLESVSPYRGAVEAVTEIAERGHDIVFVTAHHPLIPHWVHAREAWLHHYFGPAPRIIHTHHKYLISGDVLIDDKPSNVTAWAEQHPHGTGVIWAQPWNAMPMPGLLNVCRVGDWNVVAKLIGGLEGQHAAQVQRDAGQGS
jgi:5'(3')-deoxyribonucleotidase